MIILNSLSAFAADWKVISCWKGYNNGEQKSNMKVCAYQLKGNQKCSDNMWEHSNGAYDVCLLESKKSLKIVQLYKGFNQREQDANLAACKKQETTGKICVTDIWTHKQAAYDVALME